MRQALPRPHLHCSVAVPVRYVFIRLEKGCMHGPVHTRIVCALCLGLPSPLAPKHTSLEPLAAVSRVASLRRHSRPAQRLVSPRELLRPHKQALLTRGMCSLAVQSPQAAWRARSAAVASTSGRHGGAANLLQPIRTPTAAAASRRLAALPVSQQGQQVGYEGQPGAPMRQQRPYGTPPSFASRPAGVTPPQPARGRAPSSPLPPGLEALYGQHEAARAASEPPSPREQPDEQEQQRRQKISMANKGRVPWNKGRRHPPETIARIKEATRKAMQRPEVKARLAESNQKREPHTDEAKVGHGSSAEQRVGEAGMRWAGGCSAISGAYLCVHQPGPPRIC